MVGHLLCTWDITNYFFAFQKINEYIESPKIDVTSLGLGLCTIYLYPRGYQINDVYSTTMQISALVSFDQVVISKDIKVEIEVCKNSDGDVVIKKEVQQFHSDRHQIFIHLIDNMELHNEIVTSKDTHLSLRCLIKRLDQDPFLINSSIILATEIVIGRCSQIISLDLTQPKFRVESPLLTEEQIIFCFYVSESRIKMTIFSKGCCRFINWEIYQVINGLNGNLVTLTAGLFVNETKSQTFKRSNFTIPCDLRVTVCYSTGEVDTRIVDLEGDVY